MVDKNAMFLIVDDEPDMCWAFEHIFKKGGLTIQKALNGGEALEWVQKEHFQVAFLDAKLPDIDGMELAQKIRKLDPSTQIVIVSGYFYKKDPIIEDAMAEGLICGFVAKPFNHNEILQLINHQSSILGSQFRLSMA